MADGPPKKRWSLNPIIAAYDAYKNDKEQREWEAQQGILSGRKGGGVESGRAPDVPKEENPIDKAKKKQHGKDYFTKGQGRIDPSDIPKEWKRWPNTYMALKSQGRFAGANDQEMKMILDMARRGWLDGSPNADHNRKDRVATRTGMQNAIGASWWSFPWDAWREDYKKYHQ